MLVNLIGLLKNRGPRFERLAATFHLSTPEQHEKWNDVLVHFIMGLSDQQLVTGLAILIVGFSKHCSMSARHFWVVYDLAWFSSVTHLASLPAITMYLKMYPRWRDFRIALMLVNYGMLIGVAILTFGNYDPKSHECPIQCIFDHFNHSYYPVSKIHVAQIVFLTLCFLWSLVPLYAGRDTLRVRHSMIVDSHWGDDAEAWEHLIEDRQKRLSASTSHGPSVRLFLRDAIHFRHWRRGFYGTISIINKRYKRNPVYAVVRWIMLLIFSPPSAVVWVILASMWAMGVARLLDDRRWAVEEENKWAFGQVLPLLLLVLPFFTVAEVWQGKF
jgi:hypothetical protein